MLSQTLKILKHLILAFFRRERRMVCSRCGGLIATSPRDLLFDIHDRSWTCLGCGTLWFDSDGWEEIGTLLLFPYRSPDD